MSLEMAHKWFSHQKKIISRSFLNSGTLIVIVSLCIYRPCSTEGVRYKLQHKVLFLYTYIFLIYMDIYEYLATRKYWMIYRTRLSHHRMIWLLPLFPIEWFIEDEAFSPSYYLPPPSLPYWMVYRGPGFLSDDMASPLPLSKRETKKERQLTDGRGGRRGWGRRQIIRRRESLVLYKSFNNPWLLHILLWHRRGDYPKLWRGKKKSRNEYYQKYKISIFCVRV